jgi:L-aminopeptidase/D-esterase-like protein
LPGAAELFRSTTHRSLQPAHAAPSGPPTGTGRQKHDSKITVYVSDDELLALEHARLALRAHHGIPIDRGRIVREAIAVMLAEFDEKGEDSILVRRLLGVDE